LQPFAVILPHRKLGLVAHAADRNDVDMDHREENPANKKDAAL